jgi:hypothetical protein
MEKSNSFLILAGAAAFLLVGRYSLLSGGVSGGGKESKSTAITGVATVESKKDAVVTDVVTTPFQPSQYLMDLISKKQSQTSNIPYAENTTIPNQIATILTPITGNTVYQSRTADIVANEYNANTKKQQIAATITPLTGNTVSQSRLADIVASAAPATSSVESKKSTANSAPSISYGGGNSAGSSPTLHSRMGVK